MDRKAIARETLEIMRQGYVCVDGKRIELGQDIEQSIKRSLLITPAQGEKLLEQYRMDCFNIDVSEKAKVMTAHTVVENISTVDAVRNMAAKGMERIGVLNFASAKNPGGGFLNGAMAQEESLAASSTLYRTLTAHEEYYKKNREYRSMIYTDYGIYSPDVIFFRDGSFRLAEPVKASVLTLPAVNMGQVIQKGEDIKEAKRAMKRRMELALTIFASQGAKNLILGAYGCGVFRNDPGDVAEWWKELLEGGMGTYFESIVYAVLDRSKKLDSINAFQKVFLLA